jgi:hypothetical protein
MTWLAWGLPLLGGAGVLSTAVWLVRHRTRRQRYLSQLASQRPDLIRDTTIQLAAIDSTAPAAEFAQQHITRIENFVTPACLQILRDEALACIPQMKRTFIPTHKKGATLSYEQIHRLAPHGLAFYHNADVQQWVSRITGETIFPTPEQDQSSLSILCYHEPGDHIGWHYDHNFYRGRHFTVLLSLVNEGRVCRVFEANQSSTIEPVRLEDSANPTKTGLSRGTYQRRLPGGGTQDFDTSPNTLIVFEGAKVRHRATPIAADERRVILSMTYCTDPRISRFKEFVRRVKDTAFFGLRALWD